MSNSGILHERVKGQLPISIATSRAIEGLLGILTDTPDTETPLKRYAQAAVNAFNKAKQFINIHVGESNIDPVTAPIKDYDELWINFRTLFRNIIGSLKAEEISLISPSEYATVVMEELAIIKSVIMDQGFMVDVQCYAATYKSIAGFYSNGIQKGIKTEKQKFLANLENKTIEAVLQILGEDNEMLTPVNVTIKTGGKRVVLLSHYPIDLLNLGKPSALALIESHTGVLKKQQHWHTKLNGGKDLPRIPFDKMTVQLFGDTGGLFSPYPKEYRQMLIKIAEQYQWTATTSKHRILQCVELAREPHFEALIRKLYF